MSKNLYKVGDPVYIEKLFTTEDAGRWDYLAEPKIVIVERIEKISFEYCYTLNDCGNILNTMYWESDISGKIVDDPDLIWKIWGDI